MKNATGQQWSTIMHDRDRLQAVTVALSVRGTVSQRLLLVRLALMVNARGEVCISVSELARRLPYDRSSLYGMFPWLEARGLIEIDRSEEPFVFRLPWMVKKETAAA